MDLPTCPHCKQSVLDEDAEICPFCDQPMKGPATAAPPKPEKKAAATSTKVKKKQADDDDDPFELERATVSKVVGLKPKPSKGRMWKLTCPMCESDGFAPRSAAGREVKCANPECLVPVFSAPKPEKKKGEEEAPVSDEPKKKMSLMTLIIVLVVVGGGVGGGLYFYMSQPDLSGVKLTQPSDIPSVFGSEDPVTPNNGTENPNTDPGNNTEVEPTPKQDLAELRPAILAAMVKAARERDRNRKAFCRRLTAEAYAEVGQPDEVQTQLTQLDKVGSSLKYYRITPLCELVRHYGANGNSAGAEASLSEALQLAQNLPEYGLYALSASTELAVLLVINGRNDDAADLISRHADNGPSAQFSAMMIQARQLGTYNVADVAARQPFQPWQSPNRLLVTSGLVARGQIDNAIDWIGSADSAQVRLECTAILAEFVGILNGAQQAKVDGLISALPDRDQAWVLSRAACAVHSSGDTARAKALSDRSVAALAKVNAGKTINLGTVKETFSLKLPDSVPIRNSALAAAEVARGQAFMQQLDAAAATINKAMKFAHSIGPSQAAVDAKRQDFTRGGGTFIRTQLKAEFALESDQEAARYVTMYGQQCRRLDLAAAERFALQLDLLRAAVEWKMYDAVWSYVKAKLAEEDVNQRENFVDSSLLPQLALLAKADNSLAVSNAVELAITDKSTGDAKDSLRQATATLVANGTPEDAAKASQALRNFKIDQESETADKDNAWRDIWTMTLAGRLVKADNIRAAVFFVGVISDQLVREQAFLMVAAQAQMKTSGHEVWEILSNSNRMPTEKAATYRGLLAALHRQGK
ncbi:MAG: hypothetical protein CMJ78_09285 [Planctomycetaceae bacterium]|nr:hypothetical protein [Planctomycetaceae bacterium]